MSVDRSTSYCWHPGVAQRTLEGHAYILLGNRMLSLNATGSRLWALFESGNTVNEAAGAIAAEYDTTEEVAAADAARFVAQLIERRLLVPHTDRDGA